MQTPDSVQGEKKKMKPDISYPHRKLSRTGCVLSNSGKRWWLWCNLLRMSRVYRLSGNIKLQRRLDWQGYRFGCSIKKFHSPRSTVHSIGCYRISYMMNFWWMITWSIIYQRHPHHPPTTTPLQPFSTFASIFPPLHVYCVYFAPRYTANAKK